MRLLVIALATVWTGGLFAADPGLVSLAMPDSNSLFGVNVEQVMLSPFGQYLLTQSTLVPDTGLRELTANTGFDPRKDLREILVSSGIVLARGGFDAAKIVETARAGGSTVEMYKGVAIAQKPKGDAMAFPDSTLAILGDAAGVRAAIDRLTAPAAIGSALAVQVNQLSTTEDAWFVALQPLSQLQAQGPGSAGSGPVPFALLSAALSKVQQVSGGVKFGANAVVNLQAVSSTAKDAAALAALLSSLGKSADLFTPGDHYVPAAALLRDLNATAEGQVTKISLSVPEPQIEAMLQAAPGKRQTSNGADPPAPARPPADAPEAVLSAGAVPQRIRVGSAVQKAKLLQHVEPVYPPLALQARISGVVRLNAIIGKDGTVQKLTLASGHPLLALPAMEAVRQWVYQPTLLNGQAVEVATQIEVSFTLEQ